MNEGPFEIPLADLQPSQLYVSAGKLAAVSGQTRAGVEPVPVKELGGRRVLTDGHTRAVAAHLAGETTITACWETDALDWEAYSICVRWCEEEGISSIPNLAAQIVSDEAYESLWHERCRAMHRALADRRGGHVGGAPAGG